MVYEVTYILADKNGNEVYHREFFDIYADLDVIIKSLQRRGAKSISINKKKRNVVHI